MTSGTRGQGRVCVFTGQNAMQTIDNNSWINFISNIDSRLSNDVKNTWTFDLIICKGVSEFDLDKINDTRIKSLYISNTVQKIKGKLNRSDFESIRIPDIAVFETKDIRELQKMKTA